MCHRLHMACAESCIVTSRSVTRPVLLHVFLPSCQFFFLQNVQISSPGRPKDSHSGIDGGAWDEPMQDM